jgi:hypothetical protein
MMEGLTSGQAGGARQEAGWMSPLTGRAARRALKVTQSNKRMHATRDTKDVIERNLVGGRVMRGVRLLPDLYDERISY